LPLLVKKLHEDSTVPTVAHPGEDLCYDLYSYETVILLPGIVTAVPTGISAQYETYSGETKYSLVVKDRSSMAVKGVFTHAGVIDSTYTGEVKVLLTTENKYTIHKGDKIAQMYPIDVHTHTGICVVEELTEGRGAKGFGSSGR
jgi:dUTP pyrophosphatase